MNFKVCFSLVESAKWEVEDIFRSHRDRFDLTQDFLPQGLLRIDQINQLPEPVKKVSGQILSMGYLLIFEFLKEINIRFSEARTDESSGLDSESIKFFSIVMDCSMKHQKLFRDVREAFRKRAGCRMVEVGHLDEVVTPIVEKEFFGILLAQLHFSLLSQKHFLAVDASRADVDSLFLNVLKAHWKEEAHILKMYLLYIQKLLTQMSPDEIVSSLNDYLLILDNVERFIKVQSKYIVGDVCRITGVHLSEQDGNEVKSSFYSALKELHIIHGLEHPTMKIVIDGLPIHIEEFKVKMRERIGE